MTETEFEEAVAGAKLEEARAKVWQTEAAWLRRPKGENSRLALDSILAEDELRDLLMVQEEIGIEEARRRVVGYLDEIRAEVGA